MVSSERKGVVLLLAVLLAILFSFSCVRVRGPALMPPVEDVAFGEWVVLSREFSPSRSGVTEGKYRFSVSLGYLIGEEDRFLCKEDLRVLFDDEPIPFSFSKADQVLKAEVLSFFGPSLRHSLVVKPADNGRVPFPTLILALE